MPGRRSRRGRPVRRGRTRLWRGRRPPWQWIRRRKLTVGPPLVVALVGLAFILVLLLRPIVGGNGAAPPLPPPPELIANDGTLRPFRSPIVHPNPDTLAPARLLRVIDGDTIEVDLDGRRERVRYYGVDTPERNQSCYQEGTAWNQAMVGEEVRLLADERDRDRFGRLLRYVFTPDGRSLDAALVAAGVGIAWRRDGVYRDDIVALEQSARSAGIGCLWEDPAEDEAS